MKQRMLQPACLTSSSCFLFFRCSSRSGCVWGARPWARSPAVRLHAGPWGHLHNFSLLVPHPLPVCHAIRERSGGGGLLLLRWHQGHLSAGAFCAARQHPPTAGLQGRRRGHDCTWQVRRGTKSISFICKFLDIIHAVPFCYWSVLFPYHSSGLLVTIRAPRLKILELEQFRHLSYNLIHNHERWLIILILYLILSVCCRYLDSVTNKDSTLPPIPHLHSLLTDNGEPHPEVDIFKLVRSSYEVFDLDDNVWSYFSQRLTGRNCKRKIKNLVHTWFYKWIYDYECVTLFKSFVSPFIHRFVEYFFQGSCNATGFQMK